MKVPEHLKPVKNRDKAKVSKMLANARSTYEKMLREEVERRAQKYVLRDNHPRYSLHYTGFRRYKKHPVLPKDLKKRLRELHVPKPEHTIIEDFKDWIERFMTVEGLDTVTLMKLEREADYIMKKYKFAYFTHRDVVVEKILFYMLAGRFSTSFQHFLEEEASRIDDDYAFWKLMDNEKKKIVREWLIEYFTDMIKNEPKEWVHDTPLTVTKAMRRHMTDDEYTEITFMPGFVKTLPKTGVFYVMRHRIDSVMGFSPGRNVLKIIEENGKEHFHDIEEWEETEDYFKVFHGGQTFYYSRNCADIAIKNSTEVVRRMILMKNKNNPYHMLMIVKDSGVWIIAGMTGVSD